MKSFFQISFRNFGLKPKNFPQNSEALILIKLQCVIWQWIRLNEFYKLMKSFFHSNFKLVFEKTENIQMNREAKWNVL